MPSAIRTRYAPSPTGPQHIGGIRTALYAYLFAKSQGGDFVLRIEDTDQKRFVPGAEEYIIESLDWCGIVVDEGVGKGGDFGPYRQSERNALYEPFVQQLIDAGHAYYAFDSADELDREREKAKQQGSPGWQYNHLTRQYMKNSISLSADEVEKKLTAGEPYVIRIKVPRGEEIRFEDEIRGWVSFQSNQLDDKVLWKSDKSPTYHMANVVDDHLMQISHVIRGEEWLPSTPIHVLLYRYLGWEEDRPTFAHLPLLLKPEGNGKLSKRDGDRLGFPVFSLDWIDPQSGELSSGYREQGFFPDAFINMLAFLGWNPGTEQEIFSLEELEKTFSLDRVGKAGAKFDFNKAKWFNQQYLKAKTNEDLAERLQPLLQEKGIQKSQDFLLAYVELLKERAIFIQDLYKNGKYFFGEIDDYDLKTLKKKWKEDSEQNLSGIHEALSALDDFSVPSLEKTVKGYMETNNLGFGAVFPLLRLSLSGTMKGPGVFEMMELMGKETCLNRMDFAIKNFAQMSLAETD